MKKSIIIAAVLLMAVVFAAPAFSAISTPIVRLNLTKNYVITQEMLDAKVAEYQQVYESVDSATVLDAMISDELLNQAMERDGYVLTDDQKNELLAAQKSNVEAQLGMSLTDEQFAYVIESNYGVDLEYFKEYLAQQYLVQSYVMTAKPEYFTDAKLMPTTAEVETFYKKNKSSFISPENVKLAHIYFPYGDDKAAALKKANDVSAQIKSGKITFEKAVSAYSEDTESISTGGDIGWLSIDDTSTQAYMGENFFEKVFELDAGEVSGVIESNAGYHIVKVSVHNDAKILGIDDKTSPTETTTVRDYITSYLYQENANTAYQEAFVALVADLKSQASIKYLTN
jgi:parvulin-like peptidyl-prolyl isomerase